MGMLYEAVSTPVVYAHKALYATRHQHKNAVRIPFGNDSNQAFVIFEPEQLRHETVIMYFHGGGYAVGTPQSMGPAADVFNSWGYRFVSVGFSLLPSSPFPAQVSDAFCGTFAAISYLESNGIDCSSIVLGGNSAGGHAAAMVAYGRDLQEACGIDANRIKGIISMAGVMDARDMFARGGKVPKVAVFPSIDADDETGRLAALKAYSPIDLIDEHSKVPFLAMHCKHDRMSPYSSELNFVNRLNELAGDGTATMHTLKGRRYQHIVLTAGVFMHDPQSNEVLKAIHAWLNALELR